MNFQLFETIGLVGLDISIVLLVMLALIIVCFVVTIVALVKYCKLSKKYNKFMGGNDAKALEEYIMSLINANKDNQEQIKKNRTQIKKLFEKQKVHFQKIGMHKYDAFQEMGGQLSFALTLLDENNDGFIINSVHNIHSSYCYAKEVKNGECKLNLSKDEAISLQKALKQTEKEKSEKK